MKLSLGGKKKNIVFIVDISITLRGCFIRNHDEIASRNILENIPRNIPGNIPSAGDENNGGKGNSISLKSESATAKSTASPSVKIDGSNKSSNIKGGMGVGIGMTGRTVQGLHGGEGRDRGRVGTVLLSQFITDVISAVVRPSDGSKGYDAFLEGDAGDTGGGGGAPRLRRTLRQRAQRDGHMGGVRVLGEGEAAVVIQSTWRSKRVRRLIKRKAVCAVAIQRIVRGVQTRRKYVGDLSRAVKRRKEEKDRIDRLRRIRSRERELVFLQRTPMVDYLKIEKLRLESSARIVQKAYRNRLALTDRGHMVNQSTARSRNRVSYLGGILGGLQGGLSEFKKDAARTSLRMKGSRIGSGSRSDAEVLIESTAAQVKEGCF